MKPKKDILEKLASARMAFAKVVRAAKQIPDYENIEEATKFYASIKVLEWVLEPSEKKVKS